MMASSWKNDVGVGAYDLKPWMKEKKDNPGPG